MEFRLFLISSLIVIAFLASPIDKSHAQAGQVWETIVGDVSEITSDGQSDPGGGATIGDFPFLCQYGSTYANGNLKSWAHWDYSGCEISTKGCNPTSTSMVMRYFGDTGRTPENVSKSTNNISCDTTSFNEFQYTIIPWLRNRGYTATGNLTTNQSWNVPLQVLKDYIDKGFVLHAGAPVRTACSSGLCGFVGHAFLIIDVNPSNQSMTAVDPTWCRPPYSGGVRTLKNVRSRDGDIQCAGGYCGWFYINAIKKS